MTTQFFYPIGWIFSGMAERLGVPIGARIHVVFDPEAVVYIATSKDVKGLVVEADTFEQLITETNELIPILISKEQKATLLTDYHITSPMMSV